MFFFLEEVEVEEERVRKKRKDEVERARERAAEEKRKERGRGLIGSKTPFAALHRAFRQALRLERVMLFAWSWRVGKKADAAMARKREQRRRCGSKKTVIVVVSVVVVAHARHHQKEHSPGRGSHSGARAREALETPSA